MRKLAIVLAMAAFSGAAWGQAGEIWVAGGGSILENSGLGTPLAFSGTSNDVSLDNGYQVSFRFMFNIGDHLGAEFGYAFNHTDLVFNSNAAGAIGATGPVSLGMHFHQGTFDGVYYPLTGDTARVRPFLIAGFGFDNFVPPGGQAYAGSTKIAANFGAGVKMHIKGHIWGRLDLREYVSPKPSFGFALNSGALWQTEASAGVGWAF